MIKRATKKKKFFAAGIVSLVLSLVWANAALATTASSVEWQTNADWSGWTKYKTVADNGLKLSSPLKIFIGYETFGTAEYAFSPGGENTWTRASYETENAAARAGQYAWIISGSGVLVQLNTNDLNDVENWDVSGIIDADDEASAIAAGCNNDAWAVGGTNSNVAHIIPDQNKIISHSTGGLIPTAVSIECVSDDESYVWISSLTSTMKFSSSKFDALAGEQTITGGGAQVGATIVFGASSLTGSVFGKDYKYLYLAAGGATTKLYRINVANHALDAGFSKQVQSGTSLFEQAAVDNDWLGNIWLRNGCYRYREASDSQGYVCTQGTVVSGISTFADEGSETAKISYLTDQKIYLGDLIGNGADSPSLNNISFSSFAYPASGIMNSDRDGDIWFVPDQYNAVYEFKKSENYQTAHKINLAQNLRARGDFLGGAMNNVSGSISYQFSPDDGSTWYSDADLNSGRIPDSAGLKIKATLRGSGSSTPILKKLRLEYMASDNTGQLYMEKRMFKWSDDTGRSGDQATFEPTDKVVARIRIDSGDNEGLTLKVKDYRPSGIPDVDIVNLTSAADKTAKCGLGAGDNLLSGDFAGRQDNDYSQWDNVSMGKNQTGYLCYQYRIPANYEPKNILVQARAQAISKEGSDEVTVGNSNNFMMIKGFPILTSEPETLDNNPIRTFPRIDDLFAVSSVRAEQSSAVNPNFGWTIGYFYKRGLGQASRGGNVLSMPVKLTTKSGDVLSIDPFWVLYNPAYYLFGNMFSGSSDAGTALDFSSRSNAITRRSYENSSKLNSEAALYNYEFDKDSVVYWDEANRDRNKSMEKNIKKLVSDPKPEIVCTVGGLDSFKDGEVNLNSNNCSLSSQPGSNLLWPNGRVWYLKTTSVSDRIVIGASIKGRGTIIVDGPGTAVISTSSGDYPNDSSFGLIAINGAKVQFGTDAEKYNGIVFAPTGAPCSIDFAGGGSAMKIRGSLVGEDICFNPRDKGGNRYAVSIYTDASIMKLPLPGFENFMAINYSD